LLRRAAASFWDWSLLPNRDDALEKLKKRPRELEFRYCHQTPRNQPPEGRVLVHNQIAHTKDMPLGLNGFRAWTQKPQPQRLVLCRCGWQGLKHYHIKGGNHRSFTAAQLEKLCGVEPGWYAGALADALTDEELDRQRKRERRGRLR
jgi:hypothetical protein